MPRKVVATAAFGADEYLICAEIMFASLRKVGWDGECVCFSDRHWDFPDELKIQTVILKRSTNIKCSAFQHLDLEKGDKFLLVDTDILFCRNPDELIETETDEVWSCSNGYPLKLLEFNQIYMTEPERASIPLNVGCLNTGFMYIPGGEIGREFCKKWIAFHSSVRGNFESSDINIIKDQPALEALLIRGEVSVSRFPAEYMFYPALARNTSPSKNCVVLHFTGFPYDIDGKRRLIDYMRKYYAGTK